MTTGLAPVEQFIAEAKARLEADGQQVDNLDVGGAPCLVSLAAPSDARARASALYCFTFVQALPGVAAETIERAEADAFEVVRTMMPGLGLSVMAAGRAWVAVLPVLVSEEVTPEAAAAAQRRHRASFRGFLWPATVEVPAGRISTFRGRTLFGGGHAAVVRRRQAVALGTP